MADYRAVQGRDRKWTVTRRGSRVAGPFRSKGEAEEVARRFNEGGGRTSVDYGSTLPAGGASMTPGYTRTPEQIDAEARQVLNGEWPEPIPIPLDVIARVEEIRRYDAGMAAHEEAMSMADWAALIASAGGGGRGGAAGAGMEYNPVDTEEEIDGFVRENYGYLAGYLNHPEIGPILREAAKGGWDKGRLQGALHKTTWWQTTSEGAREWDALWQMDSATAWSKINERVEVIRRQAKSLGLDLKGKKDVGAYGQWDRDFWLAVNSLREQWTPEQLAQHIFAEGGFDPEADYAGGSIASTADRVKQLASNYFLVLSEKSANEWAQKIIMGEADIDGVESMLRDQAVGRFPGLADQIDKGIAPAQFFDSYKQQIASMLEVDADAIDLMDPKWAKIIEIVDNEGKRRPMTLAETADYVRSRPEWEKTDNAVSDAMGTMELIGKMFGKVG
jgi:hypothetical protein